MSDTMPERIMLDMTSIHEDDNYVRADVWWEPHDGNLRSPSFDGGPLALVPEQRALDAEREREGLAREIYGRLEAGTAHMVICNGDHRLPLWDVKPGVLCNCPIGHHFKEMHREIAALRASRDALQSDLKALLPLARSVVADWDWGNSERVVPQPDPPEIAAARAVIDREGV